MPEAEFINCPVRDGSPDEATERPVDIADEFIREEHLRSMRPEGQPEQFGMFGMEILMIG